MNANLEELIKKNKGILRQLTALNNEIKELKVRVRQLEQAQTYYPLEHSKINGLMKLAELIKYQDRGK